MDACNARLWHLFIFGGRDVTSNEAKALSDESKVVCKKSATISKLIDISCRIGEKADSAKKWAVIATILSVVSIILHFV